jgi:formylmethanofuran--tetrahydromethanopterin N-formyltransferase
VPLLQWRAAVADGVFRGRGVSAPLQRNGVVVDDTFAEAFPMKATRIVITAHTLEWARHAAVAATGLATSVIGCGCEAGIERELAPGQTPDGRPGLAVLLFAMSGNELAKQLERRVGQCVLTCPTTAVFAGIDVTPSPAEYDGRPPEGTLPAWGRPGAGQGEAIALGRNLRFFGDGWQISKVIDGVRYWRVPVMDGEFVAQETTAVVKGVGGGNLLLLCRDTDSALAVATAAVRAMQALPNVVMPFPGGVVRSGSKVGSKYPALGASTNDAFCPSLYGLVAHSELTQETRCVMEIVIDGLGEADVGAAMRAGMHAGIAIGAAGGLLRIAAGNYGGKLGPFHFHLHKLLGDGASA